MAFSHPFSHPLVILSIVSLWAFTSKFHTQQLTWPQYINLVASMHQLSNERLFNCHATIVKMWNFCSRFFGQEPFRTTWGHHLRPIGAPFGPLKILILDFGFEQKRICDLILALTWPFFIRFWLALPQNDRTDSQMAYSGSLSDQLKNSHFH